MEYKKLQEKAKLMGIKYVGVSRKKLEKLINDVKSETLVESPKIETPVESPKVEVSEKVNVAIIRNGKNEVRRYTIDIHGNNFAELAKQFANKTKERNYKVELIEVKPGITCPDCGNIIYT